MKLHLQKIDNLHTVTAYGEGYVCVNGTRHTSNLIVSPDRLIPNWTSARVETLALADFELLALLEAEIVLLGTGSRLTFPKPELLRPLLYVQKGLETMDVYAACRTYNILLGEGRRVAAALLIA